MATAQRIAKNTLVLVSSNLVQKVLSFFLIIIIIRSLGAGGLGVYSFIFSFPVLFLIFADLGLNSFIVREIAKDRSKIRELVGSSALLKLLLSVVTILIVFFAINSLKYDSFTIELVMIASVYMVFSSMGGLFMSVFMATENMKYDFIVNVFLKTFVLVVSFLLLASGYGVMALALVMVAAAILSVVLCGGLYIWKFGFPKISWDKKYYKYLLLGAIPFCLVGLFTTLYSNLDITMLSFFHKQNPDFVGYYSAAMRLVGTLSLLSVSLTTAVFPVVTRFFASKNKSTAFVTEKVISYLLMLILPIAFGTFVLADKIIPLFFGKGFEPSVLALQVLMPFAVFSFINVFLLNTMYSVNKEKTSAIIFAVTIILNAVLNYFLIPQYNFIGASVATVISSACLSILSYFIIARNIKGISVLRVVIKPLAASIVMTIAVMLLLQLHIFLIIPIAATVYFASLLLLKGFSEDDANILKRIIHTESLPLQAEFHKGDE